MFPVRVFATTNSGCTEQVSTSTDKPASVKLIFKKSVKKVKMKTRLNTKHIKRRGLENFINSKLANACLHRSTAQKLFSRQWNRRLGFAYCCGPYISAGIGH